MSAPQPHPTTVLDYHGNIVEEFPSIHQALILTLGNIYQHLPGQQLKQFHNGQCFRSGEYFIIATKFKNNYKPSMYQEALAQPRIDKKRKILLEKALNRKKYRVIVLDANLDISEVYVNSVRDLAKREGIGYGTLKAYLFRYEQILIWRMNSSHKPRKKIYIYRRHYLEHLSKIEKMKQELK